MESMASYNLLQVWCTISFQLKCTNTSISYVFDTHDVWSNCKRMILIAKGSRFDTDLQILISK